MAELEQGSGTAGPGGSHPAHSGGQAGPGSLERNSDRPGAHLRRPEPGAAGHGQPAPGGPDRHCQYRDSATAELARKRQALARDLAQQLEQAQLESDYEQIMERYQLRKDQDSQAAQNQKAMAALLAQAGDFSLYGALYGLTPEQIRRLEAHYAAQQES